MGNMLVKLSTTPPTEWANRPYKTYETSYIYCGFGRLDTHTRTFQRFTYIDDTTVSLYSQPYGSDTFHAGYHTELARVHTYSDTEWIEFVGDTLHVFVVV